MFPQHAKVLCHLPAEPELTCATRWGRNVTRQQYLSTPVTPKQVEYCHTRNWKRAPLPKKRRKKHLLKYYFSLPDSLCVFASVGGGGGGGVGGDGRVRETL